VANSHEQERLFTQATPNKATRQAVNRRPPYPTTNPLTMSTAVEDMDESARALFLITKKKG